MDRWRYPPLRPGGDRAAVFLCGAIARRAWPGARRRDSRHVMTALALSNIVLWIVVICLVFVLLALTRQLGVLHERIAPAGALMINRGPAIGEGVGAGDVVGPARFTRRWGVRPERIAPAGALMINRGPAIGEAVAAVDVVDLAGRELRI